MEARKLCPPETFSVINHNQKIYRPLHRKAKILWQLENLQNYKDLYGKPLEHDWRAKRLVLIQILLISNAHKNSPLKDINLKKCK